MIRRNLLLTFGAAALAIAIAVPVAFSRGPGGGEGAFAERRGRHHERMAEELGLDAKQSAALKTLKEQQFDDAMSFREQVRAEREQLRALWLAPTPDKAKILAAEREILALEGQLAESRVDFMFKVKALLTPAQFKTFIEMKPHGRHHRHGGKRGAGSPDTEQ